MSESKKITLMSSDGERFEVDEAVAREFEIVAHMIEDGCADGTIPIANVTSRDLAKVIEYCKKHVEAGAVEGNEAAKTDLAKWDEDVFLKSMDEKMLFPLILAANYLSIKGLLDLLAQKIADNIKNLQPAEVRKLFNIENDFTPEEEAQIRKENAWAFE